MASVSSRFIALDAYLLMLFKARFVTSDFVPSLADVLVNGFLLYGVGKALLGLKSTQQVAES
jgi:hypothetical protein